MAANNTENTNRNQDAPADPPPGLTEQDQDYTAHTPPPLEARIRHWRHWRTGGVLTSTAGVIMLIAGHFTDTGRAMQVGGFFILAGAVVFTVGVIGGWITRERPLD